MPDYDMEKPPEVQLPAADAKRWPGVWKDLVGPPVKVAAGSLPWWSPATATVDDDGYVVVKGHGKVPGPPHRLIRPSSMPDFITQGGHALSADAVTLLHGHGILRKVGDDAYALPGRGRFGFPGDQDHPIFA